MKRPFLTREQRLFAFQEGKGFLEACPGSGKTRAIVARAYQISKSLAPRKGVAVLSFTNIAVEEFAARCNQLQINHILSHPYFVGTFDAFVRHFLVLPAGIPNVAGKPTIVDSWDTLGIDVRLGGARAFRGLGVSLDKFDAKENRIDPASIGHTGLKNHVESNRESYERAAASYRRNLKGRGLLSAADARVLAVNNLTRPGWAQNLGQALAGRFAEIIVDEAQDCNPLDLRLLDWMDDNGLPVTVVCDPDQAIYGFRQEEPGPQQLREFSERYEESNIKSLTGNFRCTDNICRIAATLRQRAEPDVSLCSGNTPNLPIQILAYSGSTISPKIEGKIVELLNGYNISPLQSIILSHKRKSALQAAGLPTGSESTGTSKVATLAKSVGSFWATNGSNKARERALRDIERLLLELMGLIEEAEPVIKAIERHKIDVRWLRRCALDVATNLPRTCDDTNQDRNDWLACVHECIRALSLKFGQGKSETNFFTRRGNGDWVKLLGEPAQSLIKCSTVHDAKGKEYDAVCIIISPNRAPLNHTEVLFESWELRRDIEAKRVLYVAATRARKLLVVAIPKPYLDRATAILDAANVDRELHEIV